jgi:hypothetical protein
LQLHPGNGVMLSPCQVQLLFQHCLSPYVCFCLCLPAGLRLGNAALAAAVALMQSAPTPWGGQGTELVRLQTKCCAGERAQRCAFLIQYSAVLFMSRFAPHLSKPCPMCNQPHGRLLYRCVDN